MPRSQYTESYPDNTGSERPEENNFIVKARLNVNDLIQKRLAEKKIDKKRNILIALGVITVALVAILIINLIAI